MESMLPIEVLAARPEQAPVLANLLELYCHDFSDLIDLKIGEDGRFGYPPLVRYWRDEGYLAFLIRAGGGLAGFVLVQRGSRITGAAEVWDVAEFFVLRGWRRQGVGLSAALRIWEMLPGSWEVRVSVANSGARGFWLRAVTAFTGSPANVVLTQAEGKSWQLFSFVSADPRQSGHSG